MLMLTHSKTLFFLHLKIISLKDEEGNSSFDVCEDLEIAEILNSNFYYGDTVKRSIFS